jgi:predicted RND superfamily exporter protein
MWSSGFGIEKLGLLSLRYPWLSLLVVALITPLMVYGASKLEFSSDIREE